jgi:hypothetical protein
MALNFLGRRSSTLQTGPLEAETRFPHLAPAREQPLYFGRAHQRRKQQFSPIPPIPEGARAGVLRSSGLYPLPAIATRVVSGSRATQAGRLTATLHACIPRHPLHHPLHHPPHHPRPQSTKAGRGCGCRRPGGQPLFPPFSHPAIQSPLGRRWALAHDRPHGHAVQDTSYMTSNLTDLIYKHDPGVPRPAPTSSCTPPVLSCRHSTTSQLF